MADVGKHTPGPCPHCQTPMVNTGAPIWEDYCPDKACTGFFDEMKKTLRAAHAEWLARERIRDAAPDLLSELKRMANAYVSLMETGRDRIIQLGGDCDPVDVMEAGSPCLRSAKAAIAKAEGQS